MRVPASYFVRAPTTHDLQAITDLICAHDIAMTGAPDYGTEDLLAEWSRVGFDLARDAWLVVAPAGKPAGYGDVWKPGRGQVTATVFVHPEHFGRGIGRFLAECTEEWARREVAEGREESVRISQVIMSNDEAAAQLLSELGYGLSRHYWRMEITLHEPPLVEWPDGIRLRPFVTGQDEAAVHAVIEEAFEDHWGHVRQSLENWEQTTIQRKDFDPALLFLAVDRDEIVGVVVAFDWPDIGWVRTLGVRRPWRGRGLGMALLRHAFAALYARGHCRVGLGVDAGSVTGATRLYQRAGMEIALQADRYEKEI